MKTIEPSSIRFHVEEGEFENWFRMLGDKSLAGQVAALRGKNISPDKLRDKVSSMVNKRVDQLHKIADSKLKRNANASCPCGQVLNPMTDLYPPTFPQAIVDDCQF